MLNSLYLTKEETKSLDLADCHDICSNVSGYSLSSAKVKTELFLSLTHYIEGQEINPFYELLLADGALRWKESKLMDDKLTKWITPELINSTFARMRANIEQLHDVQVRQTEVKIALEKAKAQMGANPDFKWGANDTVRDAQIANAYPDLVTKSNALKIEAQKLSDQRELIKLDVEEINVMIDFYKVLNVSGE